MAKKLTFDIHVFILQIFMAMPIVYLPLPRVNKCLINISTSCNPFREVRIVFSSGDEDLGILSSLLTFFMSNSTRWQTASCLFGWVLEPRL